MFRCSIPPKVYIVVADRERERERERIKKVTVRTSVNEKDGWKLNIAV